MFTDQLIQELIVCQKKIVEPPRLIKTKGAFSKRIFTLQSIDGKFDFGSYFEQNVSFQENFSIGLVFYPKEEKGRICLFRCNGPHGGVKNIAHHFFCHIHTVDAEDVNNGIKIERHIKETKEYATFQDALQFFVKKINLLSADRQKHFPMPSNQFELNFGGED